MDGQCNSDPVDKISPSVPQIDDKLLHITNRLESLDSNLRSSVHGENPKTENDEKSEIATPSLESIVTRISRIQDYLSSIESHTQHLHS